MIFMTDNNLTIIIIIITTTKECITIVIKIVIEIPIIIKNY